MYQNVVKFSTQFFFLRDMTKISKEARSIFSNEYSFENILRSKLCETQINNGYSIVGHFFLFIGKMSPDGEIS